MSLKFSIDDLTDPQLSPEMKGYIASVEANPPALTEDAILSAARDATGLNDFGPEDFRERLKVLLDEWNGDKRAYALKRQFLLDYAIRYATNRLLIHDLLKHHPGIYDEQCRIANHRLGQDQDRRIARIARKPDRHSIADPSRLT
ncbi:MAG: hypothetical protein ABIM50_00700 [Novosphingobium sp.]